ncbi:MAG TPA: hypothetical protein VFH89_14015 [Sphingomicrobium sp.]|nr:hypothetical protein [Sphingomicrobium sp.]
MLKVSIIVTAAVLCTAVTPLQAQTATRDGQHAFDWEIGTWTTKVRVLRNALTGKPAEWAEYQGTSVVKPLMEGRWNFVELSVAGPAGKIEGGALRLYNPKSGQWSLNYTPFSSGQLTAPVYGGFDGRGVGKFYGSDTLDGRAILVRFVITTRSGNEATFEQSYSADGGVTWETNWLATDTRR